MGEIWTQWEGQVVNGYPLRRFLNASDHSAVFLTESATEGFLNAAIKLVPAEPEVADVQLWHWRTAATFSHPHLMHLLESGTCEIAGRRLLFVVMEYAEENLSQVLPYRPLASDEIRELLVPTLAALQFLHRENWVQGQLKPANFMVVDDQMKLAIDTIRPVGVARDRVTQATIYDPPEIEHGEISAASDVWGLGVTLVEALTQYPPTWPNGPLAPPRLPANLPAAFTEIIQRCLSVDPADRPTVAELQQRTRPGGELQSGSTVQSGPATRSGAATGSVPTGRSGIATDSPPAARSGVATPSASTTRSDAATQASLAARPGVAAQAASATRSGSVAQSPSATRSDSALHAASGSPSAQQVSSATAVPSPSAGNAAAPSASAVADAAIQTDMRPYSSSYKSYSELEEKRFGTPAIAAIIVVAAALGGGWWMLHGSSKPASVRQAANNSNPAPGSAEPAQAVAEPPPTMGEPAAASTLPPATTVPAQRGASSAPSGSSLPTNTPPPTTTPHAPLARTGTHSGDNSAVLHEEIPRVPQSARETIHGRVKVAVRVTVDRSGKVVRDSFENASSSKYFNRVASEAARKWKFASAEREGAREWLLHFEFGRDGTTVRATRSRS